MMNKRTDDRFRYAYKFRIYPNKEQEILINKTFGCCRYIYNGLLSAAQKQYEETGKSKVKSYKSLYTDENTWLKEVDSLALANTQRNVFYGHIILSRYKHIENKNIELIKYGSYYKLSLELELNPKLSLRQVTNLESKIKKDIINFL